MGVLKDVSYALNPHPGRRPQPVGYEKTLAGVCLSLLGASPLVPTDTPPPFSSRLSRCSHLDCRAARHRMHSALGYLTPEQAEQSMTG